MHELTLLIQPHDLRGEPLDLALEVRQSLGADVGRSVQPATLQPRRQRTPDLIPMSALAVPGSIGALLFIELCTICWMMMRAYVATKSSFTDQTASGMNSLLLLISEHN